MFLWEEDDFYYEDGERQIMRMQARREWEAEREIADAEMAEQAAEDRAWADLYGGVAMRLQYVWQLPRLPHFGSDEDIPF
jgi:hypothetical protein